MQKATHSLPLPSSPLPLSLCPISLLTYKALDVYLHNQIPRKSKIKKRKLCIIHGAIYFICPPPLSCIIPGFLFLTSSLLVTHCFRSFFHPPHWLKEVLASHSNTSFVAAVLSPENRWLGLFQTASSCLVCVEAGAAFQRPKRLWRARRRRGALSSHRLFVHTKPIQDQNNSITKNEQGSAEEVNARVWSYFGKMCAARAG